MLSAGSRVGPYEIVSRAGAGGMGEVWKARDTRLNRTVAIKISDKRFSDRFEREARAIAALNHPHIATLHDIGPDYLVMEYVDGEPIKGPLPLGKALEYGKQILEALHAAHRAGIVHRDLKPANILVAKAGVKVLDFGLAKMEQPAVAGTGDSATVMGAITQEGAIAGTLQYMAPEQLQGGAADSRADLFGFGCVLYEMLTGKRAFDGASAASVIAAILERPAPSVGNVAPPGLDRVLKRCLAKDPEERWQDALDIRAELEWTAAGSDAAAAVPQVRQRKWPLFAAIGALAAGLAGLSFVHFGEKPPEMRVIRTMIPPPQNATIIPRRSPAIAADGSRVAFLAESGGRRQIWVRDLDSDSAHPLAGTDEATDFFWSPDGKSLGFVTNAGLNVIDVSGGSPLPIVNGLSSYNGAAWMRNGAIVFASSGRLFTVPAAGGTPSGLRLASAPAALVRWAGSPLPDGRHFLYVTDKLPRGYLLHAGSVDNRDDKAIEDISSDVFFSQGYLISRRNGTAFAQPFDWKRLAITGPTLTMGRPFGYLSASATGMLAYVTGADGQKLAVVDRHGTRVSEMDEQLPSIGRIEVSPDGSRAAMYVGENGRDDLWIYDVARKVRTRFTFDGRALDGVWSPDGKTIAFSSQRQGQTGIYRKAADSSSGEQLLYQDADPKYPMSWSPDGKFLLYLKSGGVGNYALFILPDALQSPGKPYPFARSEFNTREGQFSPDGHWVAYFSDESGRFEVYVTAFPGPGGKMQVSNGGGAFARWRRDGKELFYIDNAGRIVAVPVKAAGSHLEFGRPEPLFGGLADGSGFRYDVMPDGNHFLIVENAGTRGDAQLNIIQNWTGMLKKGE